MEYHLSYAGDRGVRLVQASIGYFFVAAGVAVGLLGLTAAALLFVNSWPYWWVIALVGLVFSTLPHLIVSTAATRMPREMVFDNSAGLLALRQPGGSRLPTGFIPYQEIDRFELSSTSDVSSGSARAWHVSLVLKDGSSWPIDSFGSADRAERFRETLRQHVSLHRACTALPTSQLPAGVSRRESGDRLELTWRSRPGLALVLGATLFFGAWFSFLWLFTRVAPPEIGQDWMIKVMFGVGIFVVCGVFYSIFTAVGRGFRVTLEPRRIELAWLNRRGSVLRAQEAPIEALDSVVVRTSLSGATHLEIMPQPGVERSDPLHLDLTTFTTADQLSLRNVIRQAVIDRTRRKSWSPPGPASWEPPLEMTSRRPSAPPALIADRTLGVLLILLLPLEIALLALIIGEALPASLLLGPLRQGLTVLEAIAATAGGWRLMQRGSRRLGLSLVALLLVSLIAVRSKESLAMGGLASILLLLVAAVAGVKLLRQDAD